LKFKKGEIIMKVLVMSLLSIILFVGCNWTNPKSPKENEKVRKTTDAVPIMLADSTFSFSNNEIGKIPNGWSQYFTARGERTEWKIVDDSGNKVLAQLSFQ